MFSGGRGYTVVWRPARSCGTFSASTCLAEEGEIDTFGVEDAVTFLRSVIGSEEGECDV